MIEKDYLLWLSNIRGIGTKTLQNILEYFGSAENVFHASTSNLNGAKGINCDIIHNIVQNRDERRIQDLLRDLKKHAIDVLCKNEETYPENLKNIFDPPYLLYKKGNIYEKDNNAIAIVGSRKASPYGKWAAYKFASELASRGITIISGMAYGIDTSAHKGAIEGGGRTIAVLGCGVDICYPKSNYNLMKNILNAGAIVSEYSMGIEPIPGHFPARNRIISGLAKAVIVVEAAEKSGSLITTEFALEQGREVYAVPGNINSSLSKGTNKLIKDGAKPVTCVEDILEDLGLVVENEKTKHNIELSNSEKAVYDFITSRQPVHFELLITYFKMNIHEISSIVTILQLKGLIEQLPGKILISK